MSGHSMSSRQAKLRVIALGQLKLWICSILSCALAFLVLNNIQIADEFLVAAADAQRNFGILVATLAGACGAVIVTSVALVFTLPDRPLLSEMRISGHFLDLCATLASAIMASIVVMIFAIFLAVSQNPDTLLRLVICLAPGLAIILFYAFIRVLLTMFAMALPAE